MTNRVQPTRRTLRSIAIASGLCILIPTSAYADVFGRLHFSVKDADTEKPVPAAKVTLHDTTGVRADITLTTTPQGDVLSPPLENHGWQIATSTDTFETDTRTINVAADTTSEVEVLLEPQKEKVIKITGQRELVHPSQTTSSTRRDQSFIRKFPANAGNSQNLTNVLATIPGAATDSANQVHIRDEHSATTIFLDGFELPGVLQGRAGAFLSPGTIQNLDVLTGGYAPEYGGETAAVLNISLRSGPITPLRTVTLQGGNYNTINGIVTLGGQGGQAIGLPDSAGNVQRRFGYLIDINSRHTNNSLEPPQPDNQTAHNSGTSSTVFGNFGYQASDKDELTLTLNTAPAKTQIANRTGLGSEFAAVGQGYGYTGLRDADGNRPDATDPTVLGAGKVVLPSQQADGQDINQTDNNNFGILKYRHTFSPALTGLISVGQTHSGLEIKNNNAAVNLAALPVDNSIEFNPTIVRKNDQTQIQGSLTQIQGPHTYKAGVLLDTQTGNESYQLIPGSQLALDALASIDTRLAPAGTAQVDANNNPILDVNGNQVYTIDPTKTAVPTLRAHRSGYYRAAYLQDTWHANSKLTINYGLRYDAYQQSQNLGQASVHKTQLSPRLNMAYALTPLTVGRIAYNRLFIQPPLAQGAILGEPIQPETYDHYEVSIERQVTSTQTVKLAYYYKNMRNQIDTGLLIPGTQIGAQSSVNFGTGAAHGFEFSYNQSPRGGIGLSSYLSYSNAIDKPGGLDNTGGQSPTYNDHDQLNTVSTGVNYTWRSGAELGANIYHGSGLASSAIFTDANGNGPRTPLTQVNLRAASPRVMKVATFELNIENLFDSRKDINFNSGFSGTRFQQGRRILLSATGNF